MASTYLVTVKLQKNPNHNPRKKIAGVCPVNSEGWCTDVTGEHHTVLVTDISAERAGESFKTQGFHVTRVERV